GRLALKDRADPASDTYKLVEIHAGLHPEAVEHVDHILGCDVARSACGIRAAAQARDRRVEGAHAELERCIDIRERLAVGVVVMACQLFNGYPLRAGLDHRLGLPWRSGADRVAQGHLVAAHVVEIAGHPRYLSRRNFTLVWAPKDAGDIASDFHIALLCCLSDRTKALQRLGDRAVDVPARKGFGGGAEDRHLGGPRGARGLEALEIRRQHRVRHARLAADALEHFGVVGHLRHPFRRHERRGLDRAKPRRGEPLDQLELHFGRHFARLVLQAVARSDLDDLDLVHSRVTSSAPSRTCSPAAKWISLTMPSAGAVTVCSIFIASRMSRGCPFFTVSPGRDMTWTILPGMGAASEPLRASSSWPDRPCLSVRRR